MSNNLVLYRKYRPQTFKDIAGQEIITTTLKNEIQEGNFGHAFLFCGSRGTGKTSTARVFAKAVNCLDPQKGEPCNKCVNCLSINAGSAIDIIEIDAASNRGIEDIRALKEGVKTVPTNLKYKVIIIDECHQLTKEASNALLKVLEEPPAHAIIILATTELHKVLPTILSRCQRFDFRKINAEDIFNKLKEVVESEKIKISDDALNLVALSGQGSLRDAEVLLDQIRTLSKKKEITAEDVKGILSIIDVKVIADLVDELINKDSKKAIVALHGIIETGYDPNELSKNVVNYLRQAMFLKIDKSIFEPLMANFTKEDLLKLNEQVSKISQNDILEYINVFIEAGNKIRFSPIPQLPLELAIVQIVEKE